MSSEYRKRRTIYVRAGLTGHLLRAKKSISDRIELTAMRYEAILHAHQTEATDKLDNDEMNYLREYLTGRDINPAFIRRLSHEIRLDGDDPEYVELANKLTNISYAGRVALLESLGL